MVPRWDDRVRTSKNHQFFMKVLLWAPWECFNHFWFHQDPVKWCDAEVRAFIFLWKLKNPTFLESGTHVSGLTTTPTCMWKWRKTQTWNFTSFWNYLSFQMWYPTLLWARLNTKRITPTSGQGFGRATVALQRRAGFYSSGEQARKFTGRVGEGTSGGRR